MRLFVLYQRTDADRETGLNVLPLIIASCG